MKIKNIPDPEYPDLNRFSFLRISGIFDRENQVNLFLAETEERFAIIYYE